MDDGTNTEIQAAFSHSVGLLVSLPTHVLATYYVTVCLGANLVPAPDLALTPIGFSFSVRREFSNPFWNSLLSNFVYLSKVA